MGTKKWKIYFLPIVLGLLPFFGVFQSCAKTIFMTDGHAPAQESSQNIDGNGGAYDGKLRRQYNAYDKSVPCEFKNEAGDPLPNETITVIDEAAYLTTSGCSEITPQWLDKRYFERAKHHSEAFSYNGKNFLSTTSQRQGRYLDTVCRGVVSDGVTPPLYMDVNIMSNAAWTSATPTYAADFIWGRVPSASEPIATVTRANVDLSLAQSSPDLTEFSADGLQLTVDTLTSKKQGTLRATIDGVEFTGKLDCSPEDDSIRANDCQGRQLEKLVWTCGAESFIQGPGCWKGIHAEPTNQLPTDRIQRVTDVTRIGDYAIRYETKPNDNPIGEGRSRAQTHGLLDNAQTEILLRENDLTYFAWSLRLDPSWVTPNDWLSVLVLQSVTDPKVPVTLSFMVVNNTFLLRSNAIDVAQAPNLVDFNLSDSTLAVGQWVDFVMRVKWTRTTDGSIEVWRRGQGDSSFHKVLSKFAIPTLQANGTNSLKQKLYLGIARGPGANSQDHVLFADGLSVGSDWTDVTGGAFCK